MQSALNYWFNEATKLRKALKEIKKTAEPYDGGDREYGMNDFEYIVKQCEKALNETKEQ